MKPLKLVTTSSPLKRKVQSLITSIVAEAVKRIEASPVSIIKEMLHGRLEVMLVSLDRAVKI